MSYLNFTTNSKIGLFENNFNEDYVIEENSKIGLVNLKFEAIETIFDDSQEDLAPNNNVIPNLPDRRENNVITYSLYTGHKTNVVISRFTADNMDGIQFLLDAIEFQLNGSLSFENKQIGMQWKINEGHNVNNEDKINIHYSIFPYSEINENNFKFEKILYTSADETIVSAGASNNFELNNSFRMFSPHNFIRGCGCLRVRINKFDVTNINNEKRGFTIALVKSNPNTWGTVIPESDIVAGIQLKHNGSPYQYYANGTHNSSALNPLNVANGGANNDIVEINIANGNINFVVYQAGGISTTIHTDLLSNFNILQKAEFILYPVIFISGSSTEVILSKPRIHLDPFEMVTNYQTPKDDFFGTVTPPVPNQNTDCVTTNTLEFRYIKAGLNQITESNYTSIRQNNPDDIFQDLRRFLGFSNERLTRTGNNVCNFLANKTFRPNFFSKIYYLECQNLELDTYTAIGGGKKNILLPIPLHNRFENHFMLYEVNNLYMVKLKNFNKIPIRSFRFRLLDENLKHVNVAGRSDLTVVIDK